MVTILRRQSIRASGRGGRETSPTGFEDAIAWVAPTAPGEPPRWHVSFTVADRDQRWLTQSASARKSFERDDISGRAPH